jgi:hypothetical protein
MEIFEHMGITSNHKKVDKLLDYLLQVTTSRKREERQQFADAFAVSEYQQYALIVRDKKIFFEWLHRDDNGSVPEETQANLSKTSKEHCQQYKSYVWFEMGNLMRVRHQTMYDKHIRYLKNKIIRPYDMAR